MATSQFLWVILWAFVVAVESGEEPVERLVRTPQGPVRGYKQPGDSVYAFYGIPYATAPTGKHKFKAPLPAPTWLSPLDAVNKNIICPQSALKGKDYTLYEAVKDNVQENCLIANVFVPETDQKKLLPVVAYVHGGGYQVGSGNLLQHLKLVRSTKVIVVNFNYRLGIHGFLCLGTNDAPGNAGMKDQVAFLRWVQSNIASFGGNPEDVTLVGSSAGSSAVDLLMLSPAARGLFNKVIPESGSNLSPWSIQIDPVENAKSYAKAVGFNNLDDINALEDFFTTATYDSLTSWIGFWERTDATFLFSPCVERVTNEEPFLSESPYSILKSGKYNKVPLLYGFADMEGLLRIHDFDTWKDKMNANFSDFLPIDLEFESIEQKNEVSKLVKEFYFGDKPVSEENVLSYIDFMSDVYFGYSSLKAVNLHVDAGHDKIYLYEFNYVDESSPAVPHTENVRGATHCAQTAAVVDKSWDMNEVLQKSAMSEETKKVKAVTREIWLNFITTGAPVPAGSSLPAWPPTNASGAPYMSIGRTLELRTDPLLEGRMRFWDSIYERHYRVPSPPPAPSVRHGEL